MRPFDYASIVGHGAFDELADASRIAHMNPPNLRDLNLGDLHDLLCSINFRREKLVLPLVKAVSLFQTSMEGLISEYELVKHDKLKDNLDFKERWVGAFKESKIDYDFQWYGSFYEAYRICLIHFKRDKAKDTSNAVKSLEFIDVYNGIQQGWEAFNALAGIIHGGNDSNSWSMICNSHGLPDIVKESDYPRLNQLSKSIWREFDLQRH